MGSQNFRNSGKFLRNSPSVLHCVGVLVLVLLCAKVRAEDDSCIGKSNGWKYQDPLDCHGFMVCLQQVAYQAYCDYSEKFDETSKTCIVGKCPPCKACNPDCPPTTVTATPSTATPSTATPSTATPSTATPSTATPSTATPSTATPSTATPSTATPPTPLSCGNYPHGYVFKDPNDCAKFHICSWGNLVQLSCPDGLYFNENIGTCDYKGNVQCDNEPVATPTPNPGTNKNCQDHADGDMIRDPLDCSKFYVCASGHLTNHQCPSGLYFDTTINVCNYPIHVDCGLNPTPSPQPTPSATPPTPSTPSTPPTPPTTTTSNPLIPTTKSPLCEGLNSGDMGRDKYDCSKYFMCTCDSVLFFTCPEGLLFDTTVNACNMASKVNCESITQGTPSPTPSPTTAPTPTPTTTPTPTPTTPPTPTPTTTPTQTTTPTTTPKPATPSTTKDCQDHIDGEMIRDSVDCSKFYICTNGYLTNHNCPAGLYFDTTINVCNYPTNVDCGLNPTPSKPTTTTTTLKPNITPTKSPLCVGLNPGDMGRDKDNCAKYFMCTCNSVVFFTCPDGLLFDTTAKACNIGSRVDCPSVTTGTPTPTPSPTTPTTPTTTPKPATPSTTKDCQGYRDGEIIRDSVDCGKFYVCSNGQLISRQCPSGLYFDTTINVCRYSNLVDCSPNPTPSPPTPTSTRPTTPTTKSPTPTTPSIGRDCQGHRDGEMIRDSVDCGKFYVCSNGQLISRQCPSGLYFDTTINVCRYSNMVECSPNPTPSTPTPPSSRPTTPTTKSPTPTPTTPSIGRDCQGQRDGEMIRDSVDCSKFLVCVNGQLISRQCPSGLFFDTTINVCRYRNMVDCSANPTPALPVTTSKPTITPTKSPLCAGLNPGDMGRDTDNCAKYFMCTCDSVVFFTCPDGLLFDTTAKACNIASRVDCPIITPSPTTSPATRTTPLVNVCAGITGFTVLRDPSDCGKVIICSSGTMVPFACPSGKYFDMNIGSCNAAEQVDCRISELVTPSTTTPAATTPTTTTKNPSEDSICSCFTGYKVFRNPESCATVFICNYGVLKMWTCASGSNYDMSINACRPVSTVDCSIGSVSFPATVAPTTPSSSNVCAGVTGYQLFRDPSNCGKVIICSSGSQRTYTCPSGKFFDMSIRACAAQDKVDCTIGDTPTNPPTIQTVAPGNICQGQTGYKLIKDPLDCAKVIICDSGRSIDYSCPSGKYFDWSIGACSNANQVNCNVGSATTSLTPTPTTPTTPTTPSTTTPSTTPSTTTPSTTPSTTTPPTTIPTTTVKDGQVDYTLTDCDGKPNGYRFRNKDHCRVYYQCRNGLAIKSSCPVGQWFNDTAYVCNIDVYVSCPAGRA